MFDKTMIMYFYAETPVHAGSGTALSGVVDLPIQRERHTEFPIIQGSSIKGVLKKYSKEAFNCQKNKIEAIFGKEDSVGGVSVTDAKILAFPVRSLHNVFKWITCPLILHRYNRDLQLLDESISNWEIPSLADEEAIVLSSIKDEDTIIIEDIEFKVSKKEISENILSKLSEALPYSPEDHISKKFKEDLIIVSDTIFKEFVTLNTEVVARIKIGDNGVVDSKAGGLWYEEFLPSDTLLYSLLLIPNIHKKENCWIECLTKFNLKPIQIGADETIGKGFVRTKLIFKENKTGE